jgi:DNA mismatch repair ATPase MutL
MLRVIQSYALISTGVKFILYNTATNGSRQMVFSTNLTTKLEENVSALFGSKFLSTLVPISLEFDSSKASLGSQSPNEEEKEATSVSQPEDLVQAKVSGLVSKVGLGVGRNDNDRQFIFCNNRPVDIPKLTKALNEVWRKYEMKQKPAFIISIHINMDGIDINLSPDKREIIIQHEAALIEQIKAYVDNIYEPSRSTFVVSPGSVLSQTSLRAFTTPTSQPSPCFNQNSLDTSSDKSYSQDCSTGEFDASSPVVLPQALQLKSILLEQEDVQFISPFVGRNMDGDRSVSTGKPPLAPVSTSKTKPSESNTVWATDVELQNFRCIVSPSITATHTTPSNTITQAFSSPSINQHYKSETKVVDLVDNEPSTEYKLSIENIHDSDKSVLIWNCPDQDTILTEYKEINKRKRKLESMIHSDNLLTEFNEEKDNLQSDSFRTLTKQVCLIYCTAIYVRT